jgi:hypothetical protein
MCIEYRTRYACHCVGRSPIGLQSCSHRKFIGDYENDGAARCKAEMAMSYIERTDKCEHCKRVSRKSGVAKAEEYGGM